MPDQLSDFLQPGCKSKTCPSVAPFHVAAFFPFWQLNPLARQHHRHTTILCISTSSVYNITENVMKRRSMASSTALRRTQLIANSKNIAHKQISSQTQNSCAALHCVHSGTLNTAAWGQQQRRKTQSRSQININIWNICNVGFRNTCASPPASRFAWRFGCRVNARASVRSCWTSTTFS